MGRTVEQLPDSGAMTPADRHLDHVVDAVLATRVTSIIGPDAQAGDLARAVATKIAARLAPDAVVVTEPGAVRGAAESNRHIITVGSDADAELIVAVGSGAPTLFTRLPPHGAQAHRAAGPMEVAILGPIEIRGVDPTLRNRPVLTELVVYLALHQEGVVTRVWANALWPDRIVPPQTISNRLSEARQLLGFAPDNRPRLRRGGERHLIADIETDWGRFQSLAARSDPEAWRSALSLVRGRPLLDLAQGQWAVMEGIVAEIEQGVVECGLNLGRALLGSNDPDGAAWAAQMALRCAPWDERLHRLLMRAADAAGNREGIDAALRHLALVLEIDGDPLKGVHPQTAALYGRLANPAAETAS